MDTSGDGVISVSEAASALRDDEEFAEVLGVDVGTDDVFRATTPLDEDGDRACLLGRVPGRGARGDAGGRSNTGPRLVLRWTPRIADSSAMREAASFVGLLSESVVANREGNVASMAHDAESRSQLSVKVLVCRYTMIRLRVD